MYGYIYRIVNKIDGKSYIGFTVDIEERIKSHYENYNKIEKKYAYKSHLYKAIRKYGVENFYVIILEKPVYNESEIKNTRKIFGKIEKYYIALFSTKINGYNMTCGGDGGYTGNWGKPGWNSGFTKETNESVMKISKSNTGKKRSIEIKKILSDLAKKRKGHKHTEETKRKISIGNTGKTKSGGWHHSEESKQKIREYNKNNSPRRGKHHSEETKEKLKIARKGRTPNLGHHHSEETKRILSEKSSGRKHSEESKRKMSEMAKKRYVSKTN